MYDCKQVATNLMEWLEIITELQWPASLLAIGSNALSIIAILWILLEKRSPARTLAWILALIFLPVLGLVLFILFGRNFRRRRRLRFKQSSNQYAGSDNAVQNDWNETLLQRIKPGMRSLARMLCFNRARLTASNVIRILKNGAEKFPALFEDIASAQHHIHLEYYILEDGRLADRLADLLIAKANAGIQVRVIYDAVGSWSLSKKYIKKLVSAGVQAEVFMPVLSIYFADRANYRQHRKIAVIDGMIGYLGGLNIADNYLYGDPALGHWRDTHLRLEGEAVRQLQSVFLSDWHFVSSERLKYSEYCAPDSLALHKSKKKANLKKNSRQSQDTDGLVQILASGPDSSWASIQQAYFAAIASARKYVYISTPYFLPDESILTALTTAALSGVDVRLLLPARADSWLVYLGSLSYVDDLLEAGVRVYLYHGGFNHNKTVVVDDQFASVGTANMDQRSFEHNFEINAMLFSTKQARILRKHFEDDLILSESYTPRSSALLEKLLQGLARLISPLL